MINYSILISSFFIIIGGLVTIMSKNSIVSILCLIFTYLVSALLFMSLGAEFIALLVLLVYIGAISILFLFVVMMLNLRLVEASQQSINYLPVGFIIGFFLIIEIWLISSMDLEEINQISISGTNHPLLQPLTKSLATDVAWIGSCLFNEYFYLIIIAALILLLVMVGTIVLTFGYEYRGDNRNYHKAFVIYGELTSRVKSWVDA